MACERARCPNALLNVVEFDDVRAENPLRVGGYKFHVLVELPGVGDKYAASCMSIKKWAMS